MKKKSHVRTRLTGCILGVLVSCSVSAETRYVAPVGESDPEYPYSTPETAANELADALEGFTTAGHVILVKPGRYLPTKPFSTEFGVTIRSCKTGDTDATDVDNVVFDGTNFTETGPFLSLPTKKEKGGASVVDGITFTGFKTGYRGGVVNAGYNQAVVISNCVFRDCHASDRGGAVYANIPDWCDSTGRIIEISRCRFESCSSMRGGAVYAQRNVAVRDCVFKDNFTVLPSGNTNRDDLSGGHLYLNERSHAVGCTFTGTAGATYGEVISCAVGTTVSNCVFTGINVTNGYYGLISLKGGEIVGTAVTNNVAPYGLVMFSAMTGDHLFRNCLFAGNDCGSSAAFIAWSSAGRNAYFENSTLVHGDNRNLVRIISGQSPMIHVRNGILIGKNNSPDYVTVENGYLAAELFDSGRSPFVDPASGNWRLRRLSPLVDAGDVLDWHAGAVDLDGRERTAGDAPDIGCYERRPGDDTSRVVACEADRTGVWADAFVGLQPAVDAAPADGTVLVRSGTYDIAETIVISNKSLWVKSAGAETGLVDRDNTVLDGGGRHRIMIVHAGEWPDNYRIPVCQNTVRIEGLTFTNGLTAAGDGQFESGNGGGLYIFGRASDDDQEPSRVVDCRFTGCSAVNGGGAAQVGGVFENCVFDGNSAVNGGGAACVQSEPWSEHRRVIDYTPACTWYSPGYIGCVFTNNTAETHGGGLDATAGDSGLNTVYMNGCVFADNAVTSSDTECTGAAFRGTHGSAVENCTFLRNEGGIYGAVSPGSGTHFTGCLFESNKSHWAELRTMSTNIVVDRCVFKSGSRPVFFGAFTIRNSMFYPRPASLFNVYERATSVVDNCTFAFSEESAYVLVTYQKEMKKVMFRNCVLHGPEDKRFLYGELIGENTAISFERCCLSADLPENLTDLITGTDCLIGVDPRFTDAANGDWTFRRTSPLRDAGMLLDWMTADSLDLAGGARVALDGMGLDRAPSALPDIGCYENLLAPEPFAVIVR